MGYPRGHRYCIKRAPVYSRLAHQIKLYHFFFSTSADHELDNWPSDGFLLFILSDRRRCFYFSLLLFPSFSFSFSLSPYDSFTFLDSCSFSSPPSLSATAPSSFSSTRGQRDKVNVNGFFAPATADFSFSSFIACPPCLLPARHLVLSRSSSLLLHEIPGL